MSAAGEGTISDNFSQAHLKRSSLSLEKNKKTNQLCTGIHVTNIIHGVACWLLVQRQEAWLSFPTDKQQVEICFNKNLVRFPLNATEELEVAHMPRHLFPVETLSGSPDQIKRKMNCCLLRSPEMCLFTKTHHTLQQVFTVQAYTEVEE